LNLNNHILYTYRKIKSEKNSRETWWKDETFRALLTKYLGQILPKISIAKLNETVKKVLIVTFHKFGSKQDQKQT
jgi:hypothetical protein